MRLGTWNCRLNIDAKRDALEGLHLDIAIVPESAEQPALAVEPGVSHAWTGQNSNKGLGVFAFSPWRIERIDESERLPWCLPVRARHVDGAELTVLAIWTVKRAGDGRPAYAAQFAAVLDRWREVITRDRVVLAGDLNASFQGPSVIPHQINIATLADLGAHSAVQIANGPLGPDDEPATLRWIGPGGKPYHYHCDYIVVSSALVPQVRAAEVGSMADWIDSGLSDHCPVVVDLDIGNADAR